MNIRLSNSRFLILFLLNTISTSYGMDHQQVLLARIKDETPNCLSGCKIVLNGNTPPNYDVPSMGTGDWFLYAPWLSAKLEDLGAEVTINQPKFLENFFMKCSDIGVYSTIPDNEKKQYTPLEIRDVLDHVKNLENFKCHKRYVGKNCDEANQGVQKALEQIEKVKKLGLESFGKEPYIALIARQTANYHLATYSESETVGYIRAAMIKMLQDKPAATLAKGLTPVTFYNIQLEDQDLDNSEETEKPLRWDEDLKKKWGAFVGDAILMKAVVEAGGELISVDTATANLALGIPEKEDLRKNVSVLFAKKYNSCRKKPFLHDNGSAFWPQNAKIFIQQEDKNWVSVRQDFLNKWRR